MKQKTEQKLIIILMVLSVATGALVLLYSLVTQPSLDYARVRTEAVPVDDALDDDEDEVDDTEDTDLIVEEEDPEGKDGFMVAYIGRDDEGKSVQIDLASVKLAERSKAVKYKSIVDESIKNGRDYYLFAFRKDASSDFSRGLLYTALDPQSRQSLYFKNLTKNEDPVLIYSSEDSDYGPAAPTAAVGKSGDIYIAFGIKSLAENNKLHDKIGVYKIKQDGTGVTKVSIIKQVQANKDLRYPAIASLGETKAGKDRIAIAAVSMKNNQEANCSANSPLQQIRFFRSGDAGHSWGTRRTVYKVPCEIQETNLAMRLVNEELIGLGLEEQTKDDSSVHKFRFLSFNTKGKSASAISTLAEAEEKELYIRPRAIKLENSYVFEYGKQSSAASDTSRKATVYTADEAVSWKPEVEMKRETINCATKGQEIADSKTRFDLADISQLEDDFLNSRSGKDINDDTSFNFADVVSLVQCNLCKWDWAECQ